MTILGGTPKYNSERRRAALQTKLTFVHEYQMSASGSRANAASKRRDPANLESAQPIRYGTVCSARNQVCLRRARFIV